LTFAGFLLLASLGCSVGQLLVGRQAQAVPTATKTPRPTFTRVPGILTPLPTSEQAVRGALPPGVTAQAPGGSPAGGALPSGTPVGSTSLILVATDTPTPAPPSPTPSPTGTAEPTATPTPDVETNRPTRETGPRPVPTPYVVVSSALANARRGPGTTFELLGQVEQGTQLKILARTPDENWWQVCCVANQPAWVAANLVVAKGPLAEVPVLTPPPAPPPPAVPPPRPTATPSPTRLPPFDIARGPEYPIKRDNGILTIWVKVYEGIAPYERPLPGYLLKVFRNDEDVSSPEQSHSGPFDKTAKTEGEREYNLKFEMYNAGEANWQFYLAKPDGYRVSLIKEFTTMGDAYRNLVVYVAYWLAR
jgi:uncharacterized protein YgiM (DUF1202 family)